MICENCETAGNFNALLQSETVPVSLMDEIAKRMNLEHMACKNGTWCDCQHRAGRWLEKPSPVLWR